MKSNVTPDVVCDTRDHDATFEVDAKKSSMLEFVERTLNFGP